MLLTNQNSENGTFLNKEPVANRRPFIRHNDEIALVESSFKIFTFFDCYENDQKNYPEALTRKHMISNTLGKGSFSEVKLAFNFEVCELRAVKILDKRSSKSSVKYLNSEVAVLRSVKHNCIIQLFDVVETDDNLYLVLEFVQGGELPSDRLPTEAVRHV